MIKLRTTAIAILAAGGLAFAAATPFLFQEMVEPAEQHTRLQKNAGDWEGTITMFMPGMPSTPNAAKETVTKAGPFWTTSDFSCDFMGMPYRGHGCHGYDPTKGKYTSTWIDNMSSYLSVMEGNYDREKGMMIMHWEAPDATGEMAPHRSEVVETGDAYTMTFYTSDQKTMVIAMERVVEDHNEDHDHEHEGHDDDHEHGEG